MATYRLRPSPGEKLAPRAARVLGLAWYANRTAAATAELGERFEVVVTPAELRILQPQPVTRSRAFPGFIPLAAAVAVYAAGSWLGAAWLPDLRPVAGGLVALALGNWITANANSGRRPPVGVNRLKRSEITGFSVSPAWVEILTADPARGMIVPARLESLYAFTDELHALGISEVVAAPHHEKLGWSEEFVGI